MTDRCGSVIHLPGDISAAIDFRCHLPKWHQERDHETDMFVANATTPEGEDAGESRTVVRWRA